ncbi:MAG: hypothetical protein M1358_06200 [Chloroflexi bacterium]|nr:hypothetical protein [Chloroflexota bacterium]
MATKDEKNTGGEASMLPKAPIPIRKQPSGAGGRRKARVEKLTDQEIDGILDDFERKVATGPIDAIENVVDERLWKSRQRVPRVVVDRIVSGRCKIPAVAFEIMIPLAGRAAAGYLKQIADNRNVDDIVRFGARRRARWAERTETSARISFLNTLKDPTSTLIEATRQGAQYWPPDADILSEVVGYLEVVPRELALQVIERGAREIPPEAFVWLLRPLLHIRHPQVQKAALGHLARIDGGTSAGAISRMAQTALNSEVRSEAEAVARRLQFRVVASTPRDLPYMDMPPLEKVWASAVDGAGAQVLLLKRSWMPGLSLVVDVLHKDSWGMKDAFGFFRMPDEQADEMIEQFEEDGVDVVEIDLALARGILAAAVEESAASGHAITPTFEAWEPLFHDTYPAPPDEPIEQLEMDDSPFAQRRDLYRKSDELLEHPFFRSWIFDPEQIAPLLEDVPPPKAGRISDAQIVPLIRELVDDQERRLLRRRLRMQARLLDRAGFSRERDISLAASAGLADGKESEITKHPLVRQMVKDSIVNLFGFLLA